MSTNGAPIGAQPPPSEKKQAQSESECELKQLSPEELQQIFLGEVDRMIVRQKTRVIHQGYWQIVFVTGHPVNHILHAIITGATFGLWAIVWLIITVRGRERWWAMTVDGWGRPRYTTIPVEQDPIVH